MKLIVELMSVGDALGNVDIRRGTFQGDSLLALLFCAMYGSIIIDFKKREISL